MNYFEQLEALARLQGGYFYPWRSALGNDDGEAAYTRLVEAHLSPDAVVLEAGCGHGSDLLAFAPRVARFIGFDAVGSFVAIAAERAAAAGLNNVTLLTHNSSARFNGGAARIPADDRAIDLIISRRGPTNWIADVRRVCRRGARLIQVNPLPSPTPVWDDELPANLRKFDNPAVSAPSDLPAAIQQALGDAGATPDGAWTYDVPEVFTEADELYRYLTFMRFEPGVPNLDEARPHLERLLARHPDGVDVRQRRYLWMAVV